jgi:hypothetical protein
MFRPPVVVLVVHAYIHVSVVMHRTAVIPLCVYLLLSVVASQQHASIKPSGKSIVLFETPEGQGAVLLDGCDVKAEIKSLQVC